MVYENLCGRREKPSLEVMGVYWQLLQISPAKRVFSVCFEAVRTRAVGRASTLFFEARGKGCKNMNARRMLSAGMPIIERGTRGKRKENEASSRYGRFDAAEPRDAVWEDGQKVYMRV